MENIKIQKQALKINTLENMMEQNTKDHQEIKEDIKDFGIKLEESLARMEKKFAPMWVKSVIVWSGSVVGSFLLLYVLSKLFV